MIAASETQGVRTRTYFDLLKLAESMPIDGADRPKADEPDDDGRAFVNVGEGKMDLPSLTRQTWDAIKIGDSRKPSLFRYGGSPARIESADDGRPVVRMLNFPRIRHEASRFVKFGKIDGEGIVHPVMPPKPVIEDLLATSEMPLPVLLRIVEVPTFAPSGAIQTESGYHPESRCYCQPPNGFSVPAVSPAPTRDEINAAVNLLAVEMLGDFPFVGAAEKATAIALVLLPFVRDLIDGPTPLFLVNKPTPGTGGTLLAIACMFVAAGRNVDPLTEASSDEEWRKRITSMLCAGPLFVFLDNLAGTLTSAALSSALTTVNCGDRLLGVSQTVSLPVRCCWVGTGNNVAVSREIARRTVRIRLDAKRDQPWLRGESEFRHPNLLAWVKENRGQLVWAALVLVQAWLAAGRPSGKHRLGMFEAWSEVTGGILDLAGIPGFLENLQSFYQESDTESLLWRELILAWLNAFASGPVFAKELFPLAVEAGMSLGRSDKEGSQRIAFGKQLHKRRDTVFAIETDTGEIHVKIVRGADRNKVATWKLEVVDWQSGKGSEGCKGSVSPNITRDAIAPAHISANVNTSAVESGPNNSPHTPHSPDVESEPEVEPYDPFA